VSFDRQMNRETMLYMDMCLCVCTKELSFSLKKEILLLGTMCMNLKEILLYEIDKYIV
jgi:hypothetical protein